MTRNEPAIKVMMMPKDTNPHGDIFGGVLLSYLDQAGAIHAQKAAEVVSGASNDVKFVTVAMDKIEFHQPVHVGDVLSLYGETVKTGKSSITVQVEAYTENVFVTEGSLTFVAVDENRKPVHVFNLPADW